ncbi:hypothetical protein LshimejAT787_0800410 [Lyophyllum shimeji]|uniref:Uncharacterized protein n=1 Tax=Lyophyllum shimeji TaxID=47721 RepID=A0A9P3PPC5_LYOSH|nr:hypothetical protein LshimejAT787_0800410 [Lyophyllum shimeji]
MKTEVFLVDMKIPRIYEGRTRLSSRSRAWAPALLNMQPTSYGLRTQWSGAKGMQMISKEVPRQPNTRNKVKVVPKVNQSIMMVLACSKWRGGILTRSSPA